MALTTVNQGLLSTDAQYTGFKNRLINGNMVIDQRNAGAAVTPSVNAVVYTVDRWAFYGSVSPNRFSVQQNAGSVTPPVGFTNYLGFTVTSAYTPTGTDEQVFIQNIEGFNFADMMWGTASAQPVTLSFWVRSSVTGTHSGSIRNTNGYTRGYPFTFPISAANTWEYKTVTIQGDTGGTWSTGNTIGMQLCFNLGSGPSVLGTPNVWGTTYAFDGATGSVQLSATSGATFYITGVQLEKGSTATSFDYRPIQTELDLCYRYCFAWRTDALGYTNYGRFPVSFNTSTTECNTDIFFPKPMRTTAYSLSWNNKAYSEYFVTGGGATGSSIVLNTDANGMNWINIRFTGMTGTSLTTGGLSGIRLTNVIDGALIISTEL
jgi:hypothetical protein